MKVTNGVLRKRKKTKSNTCLNCTVHTCKVTWGQNMKGGSADCMQSVSVAGSRVCESTCTRRVTS
ncbi:hypothetical protein DCAR_0313305 [Daucus carota subsp. sativus]|uniref:Uncharacterized protein n=1 Tax=Daucus carota subsp. sativus TaxID=79200 RepID=A0A161Y1I7_DAUCS|nr:hypothetical protein DCAR_0313305 [Daucus carota subsp. sativus]